MHVRGPNLAFERLEARRQLAAGDVDPSFGNNGVATAEFYESKTWGDTVRATVLQPDGKIVMAGEGTAARYLADGSLDTSFGAAGRIPLPMDAQALVLAPDGKLLLAGGTDDPASHDFVITRLTSAGVLDEAFADHGQRLIDFGSDEESAYSLVLDSAGRMVVAGASGTRVAVARLLADGTPDASFSGDGLFTQQFSLKDTAYAVALQASGRIVVAGTSWISTATTPYFMTNYDMFVMKLFPSGSLDTSFGTDGVVTTSFSDFHLSYDVAKDIAIQSNGQIVITGQATNIGDLYIGTVRYNLDGSLDSSFDGDGRRMDWINGTAETSPSASTIIVRKDGRIVVTRRDRVLQYTTSGQLDTSFGSGGAVVVTGVVTTAMELSDHKLIVGGTFDGWMGLRKLQANGTNDTTFSGDGLVTLETGPSREDANDSVFTPNGKTIVVGASRHGFAIAQYDSHGQLDSTFSSDGKLVVSFGSQYFDAVATAVALTPDGKIVVGGYATRMPGTTVDSDFALIRLLPNGTLDTSFSNDGRQVTNIGGMDYGYAVTVQADGKILLAGEAMNRRAAIVRYRTDGQLDTEFSGDGITVMTRANSSLHNLSVLPDGRLLATGEIFTTSLPWVRYKTALMITRFTASGLVDQSFGTLGIVLYTSGTIRNARDMVVTPDGGFYLAGDKPNLSRPGDWSTMTVAKFRPDGSRDDSFVGYWDVPKPQRTNTVDTVPSAAASLALQSDGKLLLLGTAAGYLAIVRYDTTGRPDPTFASAGFALLKQAGDSVAGARILLQPDGRIIAIGVATTTHNGDRDFLLTRLQNSTQLAVSSAVAQGVPEPIDVAWEWNRKKTTSNISDTSR